MNKKYFKMLKRIVLIFAIGLILVANIVFASSYTSATDNSNMTFDEKVFSDKTKSDSFSQEFVLADIQILVNSTQKELEEKTKIFETMGANTAASFVRDFYNYTKDLGSFMELYDIDTYINNGKYESRVILDYQKGYITINLSMTKSLPYITYAIGNNISVDRPTFNGDENINNINFYDDYYISKGKNLSQTVDIRKFKNNLFIFVFCLILFIIIFNFIKLLFFKKNEKQIPVVSKNVIDDNHLTAVITAAISAYMNTSPSNIHIKTIKKTNWKNNY